MSFTEPGAANSKMVYKYHLITRTCILRVPFLHAFMTRTTWLSTFNHYCRYVCMYVCMYVYMYKHTCRVLAVCALSYSTAKTKTAPLYSAAKMSALKLTFAHLSIHFVDFCCMYIRMNKVLVPLTTQDGGGLCAK